MTNMLRLELLGGLQVAVGSTPLSGFAYVKGRELIAYLAVTGQPCPRERLAALLWSELLDTEARANLRVVLSNLRQLLSPYLLITRETVSLNSEFPAWIDVVAFQEALESYRTEPDASQLQAAVALYCGDLLAGFTVPDAPVFDEWVTGQRERLRHLAMFALHELATIQIGRHMYLAATDTLNRLLGLDPWREEAHRQLMELYARSGQRSAALAQYAICRQVLADELGIEPLDETQTLYRAILTNQLETRVPNHILEVIHRSNASRDADSTPPAPARSRMVGRSDELTHLQSIWRCLFDTGPRVVVLSGEAGIGKTRLAEEFVQWASNEGSTVAAARAYDSEGSLPLSPVAAWLRTSRVTTHLEHLSEVWLRDVARLLPELLVAYPALPDLGPLTTPAERERLFEALAQAVLLSQSMSPSFEPLVLLLDDLQWCDQDTIEWLRYLLRPERRAHILLISTLRHEERMDNPHLMALLTSLGRDGQLVENALGRLTQEETAALATQLADCELDALTVGRIYHETQGNPLFVMETLRAVDTETPGSTTIQILMTARLARLSPDAREVVHVAASVGRACSYALLVYATRDEETLVDALDELCKRRIVEEHRGDHYRFSHNKLREVAYAELSTARRRLVHRRIAEALTVVRADDIDMVSGEIGAHYERAGLAEQAISWYKRAGEIAQRLSATQDAIRLLGRALDLLRALPTTRQRLEQERDLLLSLGPLLVVTHGYAADIIALTYSRTHDISRELNLQEDSFPSLWGLWLYHSGRGSLSVARELAEELLGIATHAPNRQLFLQARHAAWSTAFFQGDLEHARQYVAEGLAHYDPERDHEQSLRYAGHDPAICGGGYDAKALWLLGYSDDAFNRLEDVFSLLERLNHLPSHVHALESAMCVSHYHRDATRVQELASTLFDLSREETSYWQTAPLILQGWALTVQGQAAAGIEQMERGFTAFQARGTVEAQPYYQSILVEGYLLAGRVEDALQVVGDAIDGAAQTGEVWWLPELYRLQGESLLALPVRRETEVEESFQWAIALAKHQGARALELRAAVSLYHLTVETGREVEGRELLKAISGWFGDEQTSPDLLAASAILARTS